MGWLAWTLIGIYVAGFALTVWFHVEMAPNATLALMLLRCGLWPILWATGWPHGAPMMMD